MDFGWLPQRLWDNLDGETNRSERPSRSSGRCHRGEGEENLQLQISRGSSDCLSAGTAPEDTKFVVIT